MNRYILIFSGGMDSTALLYDLLKQGNEVRCLSFNYGQRHAKELLKAAQIVTKAMERFRITTHYQDFHHIINLQALKPLLGGSSQTDSSVEVPEGRYDAENMKLTVVPNRNMIMIAIATAWVISLKYEAVAYGAHAGDHTIYPDCREAFTLALEKAMLLADWGKVHLYTPYLKLTKGEVCKIGDAAEAPLFMSWSCYKDLEQHCGKCGACTERKEAFEQAGIPDPTDYTRSK